MMAVGRFKWFAAAVVAAIMVMSSAAFAQDNQATAEPWMAKMLPTVTSAQGKQAVAVYMASEEPPGAMGVNKVLGGELARTISQSAKYSAVDRTEAILTQLSNEHTFQRSGAVSDEQIRDIGKQFGVQYLCITDISALKGNSFYLDVRLVDVVSAEIVRTVTTGSQLRNSNEMIQVAQKIAYELIETEKVKEQAMQEEAKRERFKKGTFYVAIGADVLGAGLVAYGIYENANVRKYNGKEEFRNAEKSVKSRDAAYIAGCALILSGISIHIFF
jgi:hypothetical protein